MGLFCSDCSRKGGFCFNGFSDIPGPSGNLFKNPWMYVFTLPSGLFRAVIGNLLTGIQGISYLSTSQTLFPPIYFYFPTTFLFQSEKERSDLDSQEEKMCRFPQSGFLFQISLDSSEAKTWQWWPLTSDPPKAFLLEKPSALNKERGGENHWMCSPPSVAHTLLCGKAIGATTLDPRAPTPKNAQHGFFLSFFLSLSSSGNGTTINTKHANQEACFVLLPPLTRKRGTSLSEKKETRKEKRE